jgi:hypothetical protein
MRSTPLTLASALLLGSALGCTETPPPVAPTVEAAPGAVAAQAGPAADLTPVAEPADIFVSARWKNPNATLSGLSSCAGIPGTMAETNARMLIDKALASAFRGGVDGRQIAELVAMDAPVDLLVALDPVKRLPPQALFAFSIGLTSLDRARAALKGAGELVELAPGLHRVGVRDAGDLSCVVGAAAGSAPARLICGKHDKDITTLGPYLARNLPLAEPPARDVHAELRFTTFDQRYGADIRRGLGFLPNLARTQTIGDPRYDRALEEAAGALADEGAALAGDLDRVTLDLGVAANSCLEARASFQLRGKTSWLAGTMVESGNRAGHPPAIFWRAPVDSDSASYGQATDVNRYSGIFRTMRGLVEGKLAKEKIGSEADRKALAALIALPLGKDTNVVVASGHVHGATKPPAAAKLTEQQVADELLNGYLGWYMLGFDEGPEALTRLLKEVVAVYGRKGLTDPVRKELGDAAGALPALKFVPPPRELGKGGLDLEIKFEIPPKKGEKSVNIGLHLLLMADGKNTWIAIGANREALVRHLAMVGTAAPATGTLASREGLEPLRAGKAVSSGFLTLSMFTRGLSSVLGNPALAANPGAASKMAEMANALNNLPHKGDTPVFVTSEATPGAGPRGELTLQVQKGSFEDIGVMLMTGLRIANGSGLLTPARP